MAKPQVTLTFAGDSTQLEKATAKAGTSAQQMAESVDKSGGRLGRSFDRMNSAAVFLTDGVAKLGDSVTALTDVSRDGAIRADRLARAQNEVTQAAQDMQQAMADARQATLDLNQAQRDSAQAALDVEQAMLDADKAQQDYNLAVKENGKGSIEARQAQLDLKQAHEDLKQAQEDAKQAVEDGNQANLDSAQAAIDAKDAQISLNEAQRGAIPPTQIQVWAERLSALAPIAFTVIGAMQFMTAAQWKLNIAMIANPVGLIIAAIVVLIGVIVLIATKTTWFQTAWKYAWGGIKAAAMAVWDWLKNLPERIGKTFVKVAEFIGRPFRAAFNMIANLWNNTIGRLRWTVPNWIPGIGGNTIAAPTLPTFKFHAGGRVPGTPGSEVMAILQAGERVMPAGSGQAASTSGPALSLSSADDRAIMTLIDGVMRRNGLRLVRA